MKITIRITKIYGNQVIYPVCDQAKLFATIAGTRTLTPQTLDLIEKLGYTIDIQQMAQNWRQAA